MTNALGGYWWQALAALTAVATIYGGIRQFMSEEVSAGVTAGKVVALIVFLGIGVMTLVGLAIHRANPRRGAATVMIGVAPAALVGGLGIGMVVGLVALMTGNLGDRGWLAVGIPSAVATAAGLGAFSAWWHATPGRVASGLRTVRLPMAFVVGGLLTAAAGVSMGLFPLVGVGAVIALVGVGIWRRRTA
jgi:hypothetical protein